MTYAATWSNGNVAGRLEGGVHRIRLGDADELAAAINRRRLLTYQASQDFSSFIHSGARARLGLVLGAAAPPFDAFRTALAGTVLTPPTGAMGGSPPSPGAMEWLWPLADSDEGKVIISGASGLRPGQVGLFQKLNGTSHWTDPALTSGASYIRAVHFNELRQAAEWLTRGRWVLPVYWAAGLFSPMPDASWIGDAIANNGTDELRSAGFAIIRQPTGGETLGLANVTVRSSSSLQITADADCTVEIWRCLRPMDFIADPPTWNEYAPLSSLAWSQAGGLGTGDATIIGSIELEAGVPGSLSNSALTAALRAMADGEEPNFIIRRADTGGATVAIGGQLTVEFDLEGPPN
ncbi:MAG: hypothetical protein ACE15C_20675 [Phycisphaerae bacterium]